MSSVNLDQTLFTVKIPCTFRVLKKKSNSLDFQHTCGHVESKENFLVVSKVSVPAKREWILLL